MTTPGSKHFLGLLTANSLKK